MKITSKRKAHLILILAICFTFCTALTFFSGCGGKNAMKDQTQDFIEKKYKNPLFEGADPFILTDDGKYYLYCTSASDGYLYYVSEDLATWECGGYCLKKGDVIGNGGFWAPEIMKKDGKYYMVYTADEHIAIAVADSPEGPFIQTEKRWLSERNAIDGHFFVDDDGQIYLFFVRFNNGNVIHAAKLKDDMTLDQDSETFILRASFIWETKDSRVAEGPFVLKRDGVYYLTYSANHTRSPYYAIGCATSTDVMSGYKKSHEPILSKTDDVVGVGHHSFFTTNNGNLGIVYHSHYSPTQFTPRMIRIDKAEFVEEDGTTKIKINGPSNDERPVF